MFSSGRIRHQDRIAAIARLQQLAARAALGRARVDEERALSLLSLADGERERTLAFWQERLEAPVLDPILAGQLTRLLVANEGAYDEAQIASDAAATRVRERQTDLGEAEGRHAALKRTLARARRRVQRKREETIAGACGAPKGFLT